MGLPVIPIILFLVRSTFLLGFLLGASHSYDYALWTEEPIIDMTADPGVSRTVFFIHMRKAAGTAVRQYFRDVYQKLNCIPPNERKLVHSDQDNWRCPHLAFYHVEWHCFVGSEIAKMRRLALNENRAPEGLKLDSKLSFFNPERSLRFVTCLRHPIDRLISISWYGESSNGMKFMKHLHAMGEIGSDQQGNDLSNQPDGTHKRVWYRNSVDLAKRIAATNATLWNSWLTHMDQSTVWNYYVSRLQGGECQVRHPGCSLAAHCLALGPESFPPSQEGGTGVDPDHVHGCASLFTNDHFFPKPTLGKKRSKAPVRVGVESPAPPGPSPLAHWAEKALSQACEKHSHKTVHFLNRTGHDLEDAKVTLAMFDVVLISERLGEPGTKKLMERVFGPAAAGLDFPNANRGLFTHDMETQMRAGWRKSVPAESLKLMLQLNALDIRLYWYADKLLDARVDALGD